MSKIQILADELTGDPLARGYSGMTDEQVADSLNTADRQRNRTRMGSQQILAAVDVAEFAAMSSRTNVTGASQQRAFWGMMSMAGTAGLDPFDPIVVATFQAVFGGGSRTITNLAAARVETVSRAKELGLGEVKVGTVQQARAL